ncbi:hypothetical protein BD770DRAFT_394900 [Pilaira anomala]|nr:hypothetical protein BD770DRAFT_394900 [Pilaira anomala]
MACPCKQDENKCSCASAQDCTCGADCTCENCGAKKKETKTCNCAATGKECKCGDNCKCSA